MKYTQKQHKYTFKEFLQNEYETVTTTAYRTHNKFKDWIDSLDVGTMKEMAIKHHNKTKKSKIKNPKKGVEKFRGYKGSTLEET